MNESVEIINLEVTAFLVEADLIVGPLSDISVETSEVAAQGPVGPPGPAGSPGQIGPAGPTGPTGADSTVPGPQGPTGPAGADSTVQGPQGPKGDTGAQGPIGATGADSTVPGPPGAQGIQGIQGPKGDKGDKGDTGDTGPPGASGSGSGNVNNVGTPTAGQYAKWTGATTIQGVPPATVLSDIGAQPLDADLTAIAALTGTNTIYYRSASNVWSPVVISTGLSFSGGNLTATATGGVTSLNTLTGALSINNGTGINVTPAGANITITNAGVTTVNGANGTITLLAGAGISVSPAGGNITIAATGSYQPLDADLTAIAALTGTNTIYYRSAADTWSPVTFSGLTFSGGVLTSTGGAPAGAEYVTSTADATLTAERVLTDTATVTWDRATAGQIKANSVGSGGVKYTASSTAPVAPTAGDFWYDLTTGVLSIYVNDGTSSQWVMVSPNGGGGSSAGPPQGRLTLASATPVMTTTLTGRVNIYYTPYVGNLVPIYDGSALVMTTFPELVQTTSDTTKNPAAIGASKVNDWFVWSDAGTIRLCHGPDWTNDTTRSAGTALVMVNGIWLNNAAITNGPAASRGTYVGTTRSNASSQLDWIYGGASAGGTAGVLSVWNCYNRVQVSSITSDTTASATISLNAATNWMGSNKNRCSFVSGLAEDEFIAIAVGAVSGSGAGDVFVGIGLDGANFHAVTAATGTTAMVTQTATDRMTGVGFHFFQMVSGISGGTSAYMYGNRVGPPSVQSSGLQFIGQM